MMQYLYNLGIWAYQFIIFLVHPFHKKANLLYQGRKQSFKLLANAFANNQQPLAWFHVASLGEFEQARPVIERFKEEFSDHRILITFFSPSGYEVRKNYPLADLVCYLPADTKKNAVKLIQLVNPKVIFFVKYDFWHHFIHQASQRNIPIISFSVIFREHQIYFKRHGRFFLRILRRFTHIFVQNERSKNQLQKMGIPNSSVAGDSRFDRVKQICEIAKEIPLAAKFSKDQKVMVIGSSWESDLKVIAPVLDQIKSLKLIIAPHEISEKNLIQTEKSFASKTTIRYSQANLKNIEKHDILLIDNIGMLTSLYQYGNMAYVGGAFGKGLHNVLEPAVFGLPIFCGSNYHKFQEATDLVALESIFTCRHAQEFKSQFLEVWQNQPKQDNIKQKCHRYISENTGTSEKIITFYKILKS